MAETELPLGFGMALAQNTRAMTAFAALSETQKQAILQKAHGVQSKQEMHARVNSLANGTNRF